MGVLLKAATRVRGNMAMRALDRATRDPEAVQTRLLLSVLRANRDTEYGKTHAFSHIANAESFARQTPIIAFPDIADHVERMKNGDKNILTADPPFMFNLTSGTTDKPKYIPITQRGMSLTASASAQWLNRALRDHPSFLDHSFFCITGAPVEGTTGSGIPYGSASGMIYRNLPRALRGSFVLPFVLSNIRDYSLRYYVMARVALEKRVSFAVTPNPTTLIRIAETAVEFQEEIVRSIHDGTVRSRQSSRTSLEDNCILEALDVRLVANKSRAHFLETVISNHGKLLPAACWPELELIGCWLGGSVGFHADRLSAYFGEDLPKRDIGYLASEGSVTIPYRDGTPAGILALQNNYYEFIPDDEHTDGTALRCHELEKGKRYKIILTNWNGLYRYDIHDMIEVHDFYNNTPVIAFVRKSDDMLNITGEKLHVNHFLEAFRRAKAEHGFSVSQFRAVSNCKELRYELFVHISSEATDKYLHDTILPFLDRTLSEVNIEYDGKRKSARLNPPRIHVMDDTWIDSVRRHFLEVGRRDSQYKWRMVADEVSEVDAKHTRRTVDM